MDTGNVAGGDIPLPMKEKKVAPWCGTRNIAASKEGDNVEETLIDLVAKDLEVVEGRAVPGSVKLDFGGPVVVGPAANIGASLLDKKKKAIEKAAGENKTIVAPEGIAPHPAVGHAHTERAIADLSFEKQPTGGVLSAGAPKEEPKGIVAKLRAKLFNTPITKQNASFEQDLNNLLNENPENFVEALDNVIAEMWPFKSKDSEGKHFELVTTPGEHAEHLKHQLLGGKGSTEKAPHTSVENPKLPPAGKKGPPPPPATSAPVQTNETASSVTTPAPDEASTVAKGTSGEPTPEGNTAGEGSGTSDGDTPAPGDGDSGNMIESALSLNPISVKLNPAEFHAMYQKQNENNINANMPARVKGIRNRAILAAVLGGL